MYSVIAWFGFICIVLLICEWFFSVVQKVKLALTNRTPSVEADVQVLMVGGTGSNAGNPNANAERVNPYDRYAAAHEVIQHRNANVRKRG